MKLEANKGHKRIQLTEAQKEVAQRIIIIGQVVIKLIMINMGLAELTTKVHAEGPSMPYNEEYQSEVVDIPLSIRYTIANSVGKKFDEPITKEDLAKTQDYLFLILEANQDIDFSFLKYCTNLRLLSIFFKGDDISALRTIPNMPSLERLDLLSIRDFNIELTSEDISFLNGLPSLKILHLSTMDICPGYEEQLSHLEELSLTSASNLDIDFTKLVGIKKISFKSIKPYDLAMFLNSEEYTKLLSAGTEFVFESQEVKDTYLKASAKLDQIVASLGVTKESSDKEKLDAILIYVLENLEYDEEVSNAISMGIEHKELTTSFYEGGMLYGALEKNTQICGNYAALVEALMDRLKVSSEATILDSIHHAWNLVLVDGEPYYVDATWLESQMAFSDEGEEMTIEIDGQAFTGTTYEVKLAEDIIRSGNGASLTWYMENPDPEHIAKIDERSDHVPRSYPSYIPRENHAIVTPIETETTPANQTSLDGEEPSPVTTPQPTTEEEKVSEVIEGEIGKEKFKIKIGKKTMIISGGALVGIMSGLGVAISVKKKKEKKRRMQMARARAYQESLPYDSFSSSSYSTSNSYSYNPYGGPRRR